MATRLESTELPTSKFSDLRRMPAGDAARPRSGARFPRGAWTGVSRVPEDWSMKGLTERTAWVHSLHSISQKGRKPSPVQTLAADTKSTTTEKLLVRRHTQPSPAHKRCKE